MSRAEMFYDQTQNRWAIERKGRLYGLRCGECFELVIGSHSLPCRLELDSHWFVIVNNVRLNLRTQDTYNVIV